METPAENQMEDPNPSVCLSEFPQASQDTSAPFLSDSGFPDIYNRWFCPIHKALPAGQSSQDG